MTDQKSTDQPTKRDRFDIPEFFTARDSENARQNEIERIAEEERRAALPWWQRWFGRR